MSAGDDLAARKAALRRTIRAQLDALSMAARGAWGGRAAMRLVALPEFEAAETVFCFVSVGHGGEIHTGPVLEAAWRAGKRVCVPRIGKKGAPMQAVPIASMADCAPGYFGMLEPVVGAAWPAENIDLIVTPGLAFDRSGGRLGQGGGYYDRFFAARGRGGEGAWGFGYECQILDEVPIAAHDVVLEGVVTEFSS